jgi:hypothetical protein
MIRKDFAPYDVEIAKGMRNDYETTLEAYRFWIRRALTELETARDEAPTHTRVKELAQLIESAPRV